MKKKIMQINITCGVGSTGRLSATLYNATKECGYEACFAYSAYSPMIEDAFRIETKMQNFLRRGLNKYIGRRQFHSAPGTRRLIRYIKREKPDLIHLHNIQQNSVHYKLLLNFLKNSNIPIVYTLHDCWSFTGGCYHFTKKSCNQYESGCVHCEWQEDLDDVKVMPSEAYTTKKLLIGENDNIYPICVSNWLCSVAKASYMGRMKHIPQVIYNGIDTKVFAPIPVDRLEKCGLEPETFVILGVASYWNEDKGLSLFLKLVDCLDFPVKVILIGGGLDSAELLRDNRFICVARTENVAELAEYYSLADVFVNTSIEETFGLTTAEALACGTPAIVFNSTACPEVIDEDTGVSVPFEMDALVEAVRQIKSRGKAYYTKNCRNRIVQEFSKEMMVDRYLQLYRSIFHDESSKN